MRIQCVFNANSTRTNILRITTQQKCLSCREPELIAIMAPWTWLHNSTDIQFHRAFSKYIPALRFPLKFTTPLIAEPSVHNVFTLCILGHFVFLSPTDFFPKINFFENSARKITRVPNSLDSDQVRSFVGLIWVQAVSNSYQRTTLVGKRKFENVWENTRRSVKPKFGFRSGGVHVWLCVRRGGGRPGLKKHVC